MVFFFFKQKTAYEIIGVTGVQTCALPISDQHALVDQGDVVGPRHQSAVAVLDLTRIDDRTLQPLRAEVVDEEHEIGRASCRESVDLGGRRIIKKKKTMMYTGRSS